MSRTILGMFAEPAHQVNNDLNRIVGLPEVDPVPHSSSLLTPLTDAEKNEMVGLLAIHGREGFSDAQKARLEDLMKRYVANGGIDPRTVPHNPDGTPKAGSILDLSSPLNTIVKSIFFLSLSPMFSGTNFYIFSSACAGAILYSLIKLTK